MPHNTIYRNKRGFGIPIGFWFRDNFQSLIREILLSERAAKRGYFSINYLKGLIEDHLIGRCDHAHRLWALLCLELWHLMFVDKVITAKTKLI